jgi:hypothetical protein
MNRKESFLNEVAQSIGYIDGDHLALEVGVDVSMLEEVVDDLANNHINVLSAASKLGLMPENFLRSLVDLMRSDPQELLLTCLTKPLQAMEDPLYELFQKWKQVTELQNTVQTIDSHINELFQGSGTYSYTGLAADSLWDTHQGYQQYFSKIVEHAQIQQERHLTLGEHVNKYISQITRAVLSLSPCLAAFGVLSFNTAIPVLPSSIETFLLLAKEALLPLTNISWSLDWLQGAIENHQNQQRSTTTPTSTMPIHTASVAEELSTEFDVPLSIVEDIIRENPGLTREDYALLIEYYRRHGRYPYDVVVVFSAKARSP